MIAVFDLNFVVNVLHSNSSKPKNSETSYAIIPPPHQPHQKVRGRMEEGEMEDQSISKGKCTVEPVVVRMKRR